MANTQIPQNERHASFNITYVFRFVILYKCSDNKHYRKMALHRLRGKKEHFYRLFRRSFPLTPALSGRSDVMHTRITLDVLTLRVRTRAHGRTHFMNVLCFIQNVICFYFVHTMRKQIKWNARKRFSSRKKLKNSERRKKN